MRVFQVLARKSIKQSYCPSKEILCLMNDYRQMTNDAIRIGLANNNVSALKKLSMLSYKELKRYRNVPSCYKLCAISKAAGILASRKKSIKRGHPTKDPYLKKSIVVSCYSFKIVNGELRILIGRGKCEFISLNAHTVKILASDLDIKVRSFTLTERSLSLCIAKEIPEITGITSAAGIDRNLRNLATGNPSRVAYYDMNKIVEIGETTKGIIKSFVRNDFRIRKRMISKYGRRKKNRTQSILNLVSNDIITFCSLNRLAIVFEDITNIRSMYGKGNYQGRKYRRMMNNNWPFTEIKRLIEYIANWQGIPVIRLTKKETRGTSLECYICGERLQQPLKSDAEHKRELWCIACKRWFDRDLVAVMNIFRRGWVRFAQSHNVKGLESEAVRGNPQTPTVILRVDSSKLGQRKE